MRVRSIALFIIIIMATTGLLFALLSNNAIAGGNQPPVASFTHTPEFLTPDESALFNATSSYDPDGWITQFTWNFGDGNLTTATNPLIYHTYLVDGSYTVELVVTDNNAAQSAAAEVIEVSTITYFRVVAYGTIIPVSDVEVTVYYKYGSTWVVAPTGPHGLEIQYDNMTQPDLANTNEERYRNPGYTASILRNSASNIGFDLRPSTWNVFFKFKYGSYVAYWPDDTTRVYTYKDGAVEANDYSSSHRAYWDPAASTYAIGVNNIPKDGVAPTSCHPIIVSIQGQPSETYYLTVKTAPVGITTIPGEGLYIKNTNVTLTAPSTVSVSSTSQYRFTYWDVDGTPRGTGVNPITVQMNTNHTANAHYTLQYSVNFTQNNLSLDSTGTVVTVDGTAKALSDMPYMKWVDSGSSVTYSYNSQVTSSITGKRYRLNIVTGPTSPITVTGPATLTGNYVKQYQVTFAQSGLDSTATGTVVTVDGSAKSYGNLPYSLWVDSGGSLTYSYSSPVSSSASGKQFRLSSVTGPTSPTTVTCPTTVTGNYIVQYQITFTQTGLDSSATGTVVTVTGDTKGYTELPYSLWIDSGGTVTYTYTDPVLSSTSGKRFKLTSITGPTSPITVTTSTTITGNYKTQYQVTFDQSGVGSIYTGTIVTIDSTNYNGAALPTSFWWDSGSGHTFAFASPLTVNASVQYTWSSTSGLSTLQSGALTISTSGSVTGNYIAQNCVTFDQIGVSPDFTGTALIVDGTPYTASALPKAFYWQLGTTHSFAYQSPLVVTPNSKQYLWTNTTGLSNVQSGSITINTFGSIIGHYKTQYYVNLTTSPPGIDYPTGSGWYDSGTYANISTGQVVYGGSRYWFIGWTTADMAEITDPSSPSTTVLIDKAKTVTANYSHQYLITFAQSGLSLDATGTVVTVDGNTYTISTLPASFWWDDSSVHSFSFGSPLIVNASKQYEWISTTGLSILQSDTAIITTSGSITGNYAAEQKVCVTFAQAGLSSDFTGTVVTIDGINYGATDLSVSFWWDSGSSHTFAYASPLVVNADAKQYLWTSTSGLSTLQSGALIATTSGSVTGNCKTQYYLALATNPPSIAAPTGEGWYDAGSNATISTSAYVDISPGQSRYRFNGWTTANMSEMEDPSKSPTKVLVDEAKTVTANYVTQYSVYFNQSGIGPDYLGTVLDVDGVNYGLTSLPGPFWWDSGSAHPFTFHSPLTVNGKRYVWISTTGLSALQSGTLTVTNYGSIVGNYKTQYLLTVVTDPTGLSPQPSRNPAGEAGPTNGWWYDTSTSVTLNAPTISGHAFLYWDVSGTSKGGGVNPIAVNMNAPYKAEAHYSIISPSSVTISPASASVNVGQPVHFTSSITGGTSPYTYQWYLDTTPVAGATSDTWTFTPTANGIYYVHLRVTDANNNTAQSATSRITAIQPPTGGYSISLAKQTPTSHLVAYGALIALFGATLSLKKRKRK